MISRGAFGQYLNRVIGLRILAATIVLVMLGLSIDLIKTSTELLDEGGLRALTGYAALRSIQITTTLFPTGVLIGATLAFLMLAHRSELTVIRASGLSIFGVLRVLLPLSLILGLLYQQIGDRPVSWVQLRLAEIVPKTANAPEIGSQVWSRVRTASGGEVLRAKLAAPDGTALQDITLWLLHPDGKIAQRIAANRAEFADGAWGLTDVTGTEGASARQPWQTLLTPQNVVQLAAGSMMVSTSDARSAMAGVALQTRSPAYYETRIARNYTSAAVPFVMIMLAAAASFGLSRAGGGWKKAALGVAVGLLYVATDGILLSFGEIGAIDPLVAAIAPSLIFALIGAWLLFTLES